MLKIAIVRLVALSLVLGLVVLSLGNFPTEGQEKQNFVDQVGVLLSPTKEFSEKLYIIETQDPGFIFLNPIKHAIRNSLEAGIPLETVTLLLLLPAVAAFIAAARHLVGLRGFGIFLPAALSAVFVELGPIAGIALFLIIIVVSTWARILMRKRKVKLQYLPRMALILWVVVLSVLGSFAFIPKIVPNVSLSSITLLPVLILVLLSEDFARVQLGKSIKVAISLTSETLMLALIAFALLSFSGLQTFALLNPEFTLLLILVFIIFLGKYSGLRFTEYLRFRRLLKV